MGRASGIQNSFDGGELSSLLLGRQDLDRYKQGLFVCLNSLPYTQGPWTRRPATAFLHAAKFNSKVSRVLSFQYSTTQTYTLEFGDFYIRFFTGHGILTNTSQSITAITKANPGVVTKVAHGYGNGDRLQFSSVAGMTQLNNREIKVANRTADTFELQDSDGANINTTNYGVFTSGNMAKIFEVVSPWAEADLAALRITQSADTLFITHPNYPQRTLTRVSALAWRLAQTIFTDGPYDVQNATATTLTPSAAVDDVTNTWVERANAKNVNLIDVVWNGSLFVAVGAADGTDAYIVTSPDGITWTERANPKNIALQGIVWNGAVFVAVGSADGTDAYVVTSPDGTTWTEQVNPKNFALFDVFWTGSLFVAVGNADGTDAYIVTSPDGTTWTERANPKNFPLRGITWNGSLFVAAGNADGVDAYIVTSPDGTTWTERANPKNFTLLGITWNGSLFVAVGSADGGDAYIVTSPDGTTWTERANAKNIALNGISWSGSLFAAVGDADGGDGYILTSPDGITWTERANPKNFNLSKAVWNGFYFTAVGSGDGADAYIVTSFGITLTASAVDGINNNTGFQTTDVGRFIRLKEGTAWGYVVVTERLSATQVRATVFTTLTNTNAKATWRLGVWSATTGYPTCSAFYEDRLYFAGAAVYPQRFDGSNVSQYTNFSPSAVDGTVSSANAVSGTLNSDDVNAIKWMVPHDKGLLIGTARGEWQIRATSQGEAITPTNITFKPQTRRGSADVAPVKASRAVLFLQRAKRKLREMAYVLDVDGFKTPDMAALSEHITSPGIVDLAYQEQPQAIVWAPRSDGVLLGMTYDRDAGVVAWHRHELGGVSDAAGTLVPVVESVATVVDPTETRDELYMVVKRYINGHTVRFIEYMSKIWETGDVQENAFYLDAGWTDLTPATNTISGLWYLEGQTVSVYVDGTKQPDVTVTNGIATLGATGTIKTIGYSYPSDGQTMPLEGGSQDGSSQGKTKRIARLGLWVIDTLGLKFGPDADNLTELLVRTWGEDYGAMTPLATGVFRERFEGAHDKLGQVYWRADGPFPANLAALAPQYEVADDS